MRGGCVGCVGVGGGDGDGDVECDVGDVEASQEICMERMVRQCELRKVRAKERGYEIRSVKFLLPGPVDGSITFRLVAVVLT